MRSLDESYAPSSSQFHLHRTYKSKIQSLGIVALRYEAVISINIKMRRQANAGQKGTRISFKNGLSSSTLAKRHSSAKPLRFAA